MRLRGANVLLTGAAGGLGGYIAPALAAAGANVALADVPGADLSDLVGEVESSGVKASAHGRDLTDLDGLGGLLAEAEASIGPVDVLVNNAGVEFASDFLQNTAREIELTMIVNVAAMIELTRLALPGMIERGKGHVVNIASLSSLLPAPYLTVYGASKHAVRGFSHSLRSELRDRPVSVSSICPGFVRKTGMYARATGDEPPPAAIGGAMPEKVGAAVVRAVERDRAEIVVNNRPMLGFAALYVAWPKLAIRIAEATGGKDATQAFARGHGKL